MAFPAPLSAVTPAVRAWEWLVSVLSSSGSPVSHRVALAVGLWHLPLGRGGWCAWSGFRLPRCRDTTGPGVRVSLFQEFDFRVSTDTSIGHIGSWIASVSLLELGFNGLLIFDGYGDDEPVDGFCHEIGVTVRPLGKLPSELVGMWQMALAVLVAQQLGVEVLVSPEPPYGAWLNVPFGYVRGSYFRTNGECLSWYRAVQGEGSVDAPIVGCTGGDVVRSTRRLRPQVGWPVVQHQLGNWG